MQNIFLFSLTRFARQLEEELAIYRAEVFLFSLTRFEPSGILRKQRSGYFLFSLTRFKEYREKLPLLPFHNFLFSLTRFWLLQYSKTYRLGISTLSILINEIHHLWKFNLKFRNGTALSILINEIRRLLPQYFCLTFQILSILINEIQSNNKDNNTRLIVFLFLFSLTRFLIHVGACVS